MNDEKWSELKDSIREKSTDFSEKVEDASTEDDLGNKVKAKKEIVEFKVELGRIRIERTTRPTILEKKTHYHKGSGGAKVEYILSDSEVTHKIEIFKEDETSGNWQPLDVPTERLSF